MKKLDKIQKFLPAAFIPFVEGLICDKDDLDVQIAKPRFSKWGDFRKINGHYLITVNSNLNPYQFLLTLLHEYAHYLTRKKFGPDVKPHGKEWKEEYRNILHELLRTNKLPYELSQAVVHYAINPRASVNSDANLKMILERYSGQEAIQSTTLEDLEPGERFIFNGRMFERLEKRRKLIRCRDLKKDKDYLFQPHTIVKKL
ncbi:MAG: ImmA/IrrE family metallo-endopeptidase [Chlorobi bacterium]|nr:ImmA/IrrE family metallo-endopeptidase [Chlorobiota bacterium]